MIRDHTRITHTRIIQAPGISQFRDQFYDEANCLLKNTSIVLSQLIIKEMDQVSKKMENLAPEWKADHTELGVAYTLFEDHRDIKLTRHVEFGTQSSTFS